MLKAGERAPEFVLQDESGVDTSLTDLLEHGPLILYFYPADFTPGCTKEACTIRDMHDEILSVGLNVAGISPQDPDSHTRFREKNDLSFTLLCDPDKVVARMYGVDGPFGVGVRRATFLIGRDRSIQDSVLADVFISQHGKFIRKAVMLRQTAGIHVRDLRG